MSMVKSKVMALISCVIFVGYTSITAAEDLNQNAEEQFKEACQKFAQEDGIQSTEMPEYMAQCLMDLKMANSPIDEDGMELFSNPPNLPPANEPTKKK